MPRARMHADTTTMRALDIGCGVGGVSFQLARYFNSVVGVDISAEQLTAARHLQKEGTLQYGGSGKISTDMKHTFSTIYCR